MPHYDRLAQLPDGLATRHELRSWDLQPGGPAVATVTVVAAVSGRRRREPLYHVDQAVAVLKALPGAAQVPGAQGTVPSRVGAGR